MKPEDVQGRRVRLMFQDEARFGRMVRIRRCPSVIRQLEAGLPGSPPAPLVCLASRLGLG